MAKFKVTFRNGPSDLIVDADRYATTPDSIFVDFTSGGTAAVDQVARVDATRISLIELVRE